jgi:hypothetical protein
MVNIKFKVPREVVLLPGGKDTNFIYQVNPPLKEKYVADVNAFEKLEDRVILISQLKSRLVCQALGDGVGSSRYFLNNLILLDDLMPTLVAKMLVYANLLRTHRLCEVVDFLDCSLINDVGPLHCKLKIKRLLYHLAIGMTKENVWNCNYLADKTKFPGVPEPCMLTEDFLDCIYRKTLLEPLDEDIFDYGKIETQGDGRQLMKLNLQLRFRK